VYPSQKNIELGRASDVNMMEFARFGSAVFRIHLYKIDSPNPQKNIEIAVEYNGALWDSAAPLYFNIHGHNG
jgi:hypothetical protein